MIEIDETDAPAQSPFEEAVERVRSEDAPQAAPDHDPGRPLPIALVYPSQSGGSGHVVVVLDTVPRTLACTCPAMRSIGYRPSGCWAMQAARRILGMTGP